MLVIYMILIVYEEKQIIYLFIRALSIMDPSYRT